MIDISGLNYSIKKDIDFLTEVDNCTIDELSKKLSISRSTLSKIDNGENVDDYVLEKIYSYIYESDYRLNSVKEDLLKESSKDLILFHGSKTGLSIVSSTGSRNNCDFGNGFYLSESYNNALSFVCENASSSVYSFKFNMKELNIIRFDCSLEWMIAICYYRGTIKDYSKSKKVLKIIESIENADVVIAPIADNKMFYIMNLFTNGDINSSVALHSLSASKLGLQYIFKSDLSIKHLQAIERYYLCKKEKDDCKETLINRSKEIETKLKLAKREYREGLYIEELLK